MVQLYLAQHQLQTTLEGCMYKCRRYGPDFYPQRYTVHLRLWGLSFSVQGDVPNWDSCQTQNLSSTGLWSDPKLEFSGTKSDPDPQECQICLLGSHSEKDQVISWYLLGHTINSILYY